MTERLQIYKCELCGSVVEVLHAGVGTLICCGQPMERFKENSVGAAREAHLPVVEKIAGGYKVTVGNAPHPMTKKHYIEWIELVTDDRTCRQFLSPGGKGEATFMIHSEHVTVREYCSLHGLWRTDQ